MSKNGGTLRKAGSIPADQDVGVLGVRLSSEELEKLRGWCESTGMSTSQAVRQVVRLIVGLPSAIPALVEVNVQVERRKTP